MRSYLKLIVFIFINMMCTQLQATTVINFSLSEQVAVAHDCVRAVVVSRHLDGDGMMQVYLEIEESVYGSMQGGFKLSIPTNIAGAPNLIPGQNYMLFLNLNNRIEQVIGLAWGAYEIHGPDEIIKDGMGQSIELKSKADRQVNFSFSRQAPDFINGNLSYPEFKKAIQSVHHDYITQGGRLPNRPVN